MSQSPSQDPFAPPPPPPPPPASSTPTPPPPPTPASSTPPPPASSVPTPPPSAPTPPPPSAPAPQYSNSGYQQTEPIPGFQPTGPIPNYQPTGPVPSYPTSAQPQPVAPSPQPAAPRGAGATFFASLFDLSFNTYITRRLAGVFYVIGLVAIGIGAIGALFSGLATAFAAMSSGYTSGIGVLTLFTTLIGVPLIALVMVIALRLALEAGVALIAVAENTGRQAADPDTKS